MKSNEDKPKKILKLNENDTKINNDTKIMKVVKV